MATAPARSFAIDSLNHVVLRVRDIERSESFYRDVLGLEVRRRRAGHSVFFTCGRNDHDVAIFSVGREAPAAEDNRAGLYHFALRLEGGIEALRAAYRHFRANEVDIVGITHHGDTKSIYLKDPDGIEIEIYCDTEPDPNGTEASVRAELEADS
jgi:catechol 2,3-dioxygenase